jgi:dihydroorotate dehydrogenase electron transfer subunit
VAPLLFLAQEALKNNCKIDFIIGARNKNLLFGENYARALGARVHITTDDGSLGAKGYNVNILEKLLTSNSVPANSINPALHGGEKISAVFACGPERMLSRVAEICQQHKTPCELSLERYMKCGFGVCGACAMDDSGWRACRDGPVIVGEEALKLKEFGKYRRDSVGTKIIF